jgi:hypothetical protein
VTSGPENDGDWRRLRLTPQNNLLKRRAVSGAAAAKQCDDVLAEPRKIADVIVCQRTWRRIEPTDHPSASVHRHKARCSTVGQESPTQ